MIKALLLTGVSAFFLSTAIAAEAPDCIARNQPLPVNNEQVLHWKQNSRDGFKDRGHIHGTLTSVYKDKSGHRHFQVTIGDESNETIEVIYNQEFGAIPKEAMQIGAEVESCGDYITSNKRGKYQPSPDGAIIHWVHESTSPKHDSGYVMINGVLFGYIQ